MKKSRDEQWREKNAKRYPPKKGEADPWAVTGRIDPPRSARLSDMFGTWALDASVSFSTTRASYRYEFTGKLDTTWDSIGGLEEAKAALREAIENPRTHAGLYAAYRKRAPKGVLLCGPPGCGKTMLAKAAARALAEQEALLLYVAGPELQSMYAGETERRIKELFENARDFKRRTGKPAVIFIDESETILRSREGAISYEQANVAAFLAEMDGLTESAAFVILATNRPTAIDAAILRDGRIDRKVFVSRPDRAAAEAIFLGCLKDVPLSGVTPAQAAADAVGFAFSDETIVLEVRASWADVSARLLLSDVLSGAMIAGAVDRATEHAIQRDLRTGAKAPSGITVSDLRAGILATAKELRHADLTEDAAAKLREALEQTPRNTETLVLN